MTTFIPAYDTEGHGMVFKGKKIPSCLEACRAITEVHRRRKVPATFFIVGSLLKEHASEFRALLDDPLFEIASHSWSHKLFLDHPVCGRGVSLSEVKEELTRAKKTIEDVFGRPCTGMRTPVGFAGGLRSSPAILALICGAGHSYVSSELWGHDCSLPAPLTQSYTYDEQGFPGLREFPGHGWHENLLKGHNRIWGMSAEKLLLFPPVMPEAIPPGYVKTPEEEFQYNSRPLIDRGVADGLRYVSLIWHPWSLGWFDPAMTMLDLTFDHAISRGMDFTTFSQLHAQLSQTTTDRHEVTTVH